MNYSLFVIVCLIIHAVVNIDIFRKKPTVSLPAIGSYRVFLISVGLYFVIDLLWAIFEENKLPVALYVATFIYFIIMGFTVLAWMRYTTQYLRSNKWVSRVMMVFGNAFFLAEIILLIVNLFTPTPIMFSVDMVTCAYVTYKARNIMLYVQILMYVFLFVYTMIFAIRAVRFKKRRYITIGLYSLIMGVALSIQIYYPYLPLYSIGSIIGASLLNAFVINDIKEEYKSALQFSRSQVAQGMIELNETKIIAYSDPLTGIKNKHAYVEEEERIDRLIGQNKMGEFAVIVFDLNGLKVINDTKGHDEGDAYIIEAVSSIRRFFENDNLYRFGGDEFVLILEGQGYASRNDRLGAFERYIDQCLEDEGKPIVSSGMSVYRKGQDNTYRAVFNRADKNMYARKDRLKDHR